MYTYPAAEQILALSVQSAMEQLSRQVSIMLAPDAWSFETELAEELVQLEICGVTGEGDAESVVVGESASWNVVVRRSDEFVGATTAEHVEIFCLRINYKTI